MGGLSSGAAVAFLLLLAGCAGDGEEPVPEDDAVPGPGTTHTVTVTKNGPPSGGGGSPGDAQGNRAPTGSIAISAQAGGAPLRVDFTLDGVDQDGDLLQWTLDVDGDGVAEVGGQELPALANHTYTKPGLYAVTYVLSDGRLKATYQADVNVTGDGPGFQSFHGAWPAAGVAECGYGFLQTEGVTYVLMAVNETTRGLEFTATFVSKAPAVHFQVDFFGPEGYIDTWATPELETMVTGNVPLDADRAYFYACGGGADMQVSYLAGVAH